MKQHPVGFLCYARFDDEFEKGRLSALRERLRNEVRFHTGNQTFDIFQDQMHIAWGQDWQRRLDESLQAAMFLIPIITPSFFNSKHCRAELEKFLTREQQLGRRDLILPVYYLTYAPLNRYAQVADPLVEAMRKRQRFDWRELRFEPLDGPPVRRKLAKMAEQITETMDLLKSAPPPLPAAQPTSSPSQQTIENQAASYGAQGVFYGPVTFYQGQENSSSEENDKQRSVGEYKTNTANDKAITNHTRATEIDRIDREAARVYAHRGFTHKSLGQHERAIAVYDEAIRRDPEYAVAYAHRGVAYANLKAYERAIEDYNNAIRFDPEYAFAYINRGLAYASLGQHKRAIEDYNEAIRLDPAYARTYWHRGLSYRKIGEYERAIANYDNAIRLDPEDALAYHNRGVAYAKMDDLERAIANFDEAIRLDPAYALAYRNRGIMHMHLGNTTQAIADFEHVLTLDSANDGWRADAERELRELGAR